MREFLFRGKRKDNNEWAYGDYWRVPEDSGSYDVPPSSTLTHYIARYDVITHECVEIDETTLGQFTGLLDKQGKKIFEGDIVKCNWLAELGITELDCEASGVVQWNDENPCFYVHLLKTYERHIGNEMSYEETDLGLAPSTDEGIHIEVIGNIHDTPK